MRRYRDEDEAYDEQRQRLVDDGRELLRMRMILPWPISANDYWRSVPNPRTGRMVVLVSREARAYKKLVAWRAVEFGFKRPLEGDVELRLRLVPDSQSRMDLDNAMKVVIDALKGVVFVDDRQIVRIFAERAKREKGVGNRRLEVDVFEVVDGAPVMTDDVEDVLREVLRYGTEGKLIDDALHQRIEAAIPKRAVPA